MTTDNYLGQILTLFKNVTLNSLGSKRTFLEYLQAGDIGKALSLMQEHDDEVDNALREYNPQTHKIMSRPDKPRKGDAPYRTEKLPRTRQRYINEVELFFLLGGDIQWTQKGGTEEAYDAFLKMIEDVHFNARTRTAKRKAGAETEVAKLYNVYRNSEGKADVNLVVLSRSTGYKLRTLFDQYGNLTAFAYGYKQKEGGRTVEHWDFQTAELLFFCQRAAIGWSVETAKNPTGKINVLYIRQPKAWDGVEPRLAREEELDSKIADTNNYFADPIATATADVINSMLDPSKPGKLIQLSGPNSSFSYVNPPQQSEIRRAEKEELERSILFDTMTPDLSFDNLKGMGTLSGAAIRNSFILGYIKRARNMEIYEEMTMREKNVILAILRYMHPEIDWTDFDVAFQFAEPFGEDKRTERDEVSSLYGAGLMSLTTAVDRLDIVDDVEAEVDRINMEHMDAEAQKQAEGGAETQTAATDGKQATAEEKTETNDNKEDEEDSEKNSGEAEQGAAENGGQNA